MLTYRFVEADGEPSESDVIIVSRPTGPDEVIQDGKSLGKFFNTHDLCSAIWAHMEATKFWPNVWFQNERGCLDLCVIEFGK
jgi:hypothetical protein